MKERIGYAAKDRDSESLSLNASIRDNIAIGGFNRFALRGFLVLPGREILMSRIVPSIRNAANKAASPNRGVKFIIYSGNGLEEEARS